MNGSRYTSTDVKALVQILNINITKQKLIHLHLFKKSINPFEN